MKHSLLMHARQMAPPYIGLCIYMDAVPCACDEASEFLLDSAISQFASHRKLLFVMERKYKVPGELRIAVANLLLERRRLVSSRLSSSRYLADKLSLQIAARPYNPNT